MVALALLAAGFLAAATAARFATGAGDDAALADVAPRRLLARLVVVAAAAAFLTGAVGDAWLVTWVGWWMDGWMHIVT